MKRKEKINKFVDKILCRICNEKILTKEMKFHSQTCRKKIKNILNLASFNSIIEELATKARETINNLKLNFKIEKLK